MMMRTYAMCWAVAVMLLSGSWSDSAAQSLPAAPRTFAGKYAMLDGDISLWVDKDYIDRALARVKAAGFNVYMPTVWQGRGTTWPSRYAPWDVELKGHPKAGFDPLRYLITAAHALGLEVHPWVTLTLRQSDILPEFAPPGTPEGAFDVHNPQFRTMMANLAAELVERYEVDGLNLDYVRAIGLCSSEACAQQYRFRYGRTLSTDSTLFSMTFGKTTPIAEFQESAVTEMVQGIVTAVRRVKPDLLISVDAIPGQSGPEQGQASVKWVNDGLVDAILRMDYFPRINVPVTDSIRGQLRAPNALTLLICNMATEEELASPTQPRFPRSGAWMARTVAEIQSRWPQTGVAVYFYKYFSDEQVTSLRTGPFKGRLEGPRQPVGLSIH